MSGSNDDANFLQRDADFKPHDFQQFPENNEGAVFDASQYAFFGKDVVEEVELGGLEDDDPPLSTLDDDEFGIHPTILDDDEIFLTDGQLGDIDGGSRNIGNIGDETVSESHWRNRTSSSNRLDQILKETDIYREKRWSSHPHFSPTHYQETPLHRTSSYQDHPRQYSPGREPVGTSPYAPPGPSYHHLLHRGHLNLLYGPDMDASRAPAPPPFPPSSDFTLSASVSHPLHHPMNPTGFSGSRPPNWWAPSFQPQLLLGPSMHQPRLLPPPFARFAPHDRPFLSPENCSEPFFTSDRRPSSQGREVHLLRRPQARSKHMTAEELEAILRIQHAATRTDDPYVDDYYNQARLSVKSDMKLRFSPGSISEQPRRDPHPHPFLQVDALGRVPFPSFRRPRPLIELDPPPPPPSPTGFGQLLELDPVLAARAATEHCHSAVLDVDDIDRFLRFNRVWDGGVELRRRRRSLLEGVAATLRLVDPLKGTVSPEDDALFLAMAAIPKGRKLLSRYLQLVFTGGGGGGLLRLLCMTFFRNLRFIFPSVGGTGLTSTLSSCVRRMDLSQSAACLVAVVCSAEHPLGGPGASFFLKSVLERAAELLTDRRKGRELPDRALWEASFDEFFTLLTDHCVQAYHSVAAGKKNGRQAMGREIPVELLRASLPHTNERQRTLLLNFARLSLPAAAIGDAEV